jgi:hypothetical protein
VPAGWRRPTGGSESPRGGRHQLGRSSHGCARCLRGYVGSRPWLLAEVRGPVILDFQAPMPGSFDARRQSPRPLPALATAGREVRPATARPIPFASSLPVPPVWHRPQSLKNVFFCLPNMSKSVKHKFWDCIQARRAWRWATSIMHELCGVTIGNYDCFNWKQATFGERLPKKYG